MQHARSFMRVQHAFFSPPLSHPVDDESAVIYGCVVAGSPSGNYRAWRKNSFLYVKSSEQPKNDNVNDIRRISQTTRLFFSNWLFDESGICFCSMIISRHQYFRNIKIFNNDYAIIRTGAKRNKSADSALSLMSRPPFSHGVVNSRCECYMSMEQVQRDIRSPAQGYHSRMVIIVPQITC